MKINDDCFYWVGHSIGLDKKFGLSRNVMNFVANLIHWVERNLRKSFLFSPICLLLIYWLIYLFISVWRHGNLYCSMVSSSLFSLLFWSNSPTFDFIELHHPSPCSLLTWPHCLRVFTLLFFYYHWDCHLNFISTETLAFAHFSI